MKITDYPLLDTISADDDFIIETEEGTKRVKYSTVSGVEGMLDMIYPVGALYLSYEDTSPAELFGGSWTQINGYFLRAANDTNTGGADSYSLTTAQMPAHSHGTVTGSGDRVTMMGNETAQHVLRCWSGVPYNIVTSAVGGGAAFGNMPQYQNVYVWRRVS